MDAVDGEFGHVVAELRVGGVLEVLIAELFSGLFTLPAAEGYTLK